ncbi:Wzz/FepE/Etk N-terminal domain-containing protein [Crocinitomicaceae bacterium]|nr:Wzz/FepE/Etk N-terminal domain-containing protein [Crocinitomicaceae bacterium]
MEQNETHLEEERQNLLVFIWKNRRIILMVTAAAAIISLVVSFFLTPLYKSQAVVFPAATSTVSFSEQRNAKASSMDFGEEEQAEQLVQILKSSKIRNILIERFDLFKNYDIDLSDVNKNFKLNKAYNNHIQFNRTRYGSIEIDVLDKNPELAATIANKIVDLIDTVKNEMVQERTIPAFEINQRKRGMLESQMKKLQAEMDSLSVNGVVPTESRANLYQAYNDASAAKDKAFFQNQIDVNLQFGAKFDGLQMLRDEMIVKLAKFEDSYEQAESDANTLFNHKFIVESAVIADKKDRPKKALIILMATFGAFFFMVFALLLRERFKELKRIA